MDERLVDFIDETKINKIYYYILKYIILYIYLSLRRKPTFFTVCVQWMTFFENLLIHSDCSRICGVCWSPWFHFTRHYAIQQRGTFTTLCWGPLAQLDPRAGFNFCTGCDLDTIYFVVATFQKLYFPNWFKIPNSLFLKLRKIQSLPYIWQ